MKISNMYLPTLREAPADADSKSYQLMLRAGLIRKVSSGIYSYLPLGSRVLRKIEMIIKEEMEAEGALEVVTSGLVPAEIYHRAKSWNTSEDVMFKLCDNNRRDFGLANGFEEVFTDIIKNDTKPYKIFPLFFYEIQARYRDERKPRFGVMRSRVFTMKSACSFDLDLQGLDKSYKRMFDTYCRIFKRCGLKYIDAEAGKGETEGKEFFIEWENGESEIACCDKCGYMWSAKTAPCVPHKLEAEEPIEIEKVFTPGVRTIEELTKFLNISSRRLAKTLIYKIDGKVVAAMVRGDREISEAKLCYLLKAHSLEMADPETVKNATNAEVGFAGPIGIKADVLLVDNEIINMYNFVVGANETEYHLANVNYGRDFKAHVVGDIRNIVNSDRCPQCGNAIYLKNGMKIGSLFKIGSRYTEPMHAYYIDERGNEKPIVMGSYSMGIDRIMAAIIEQNHDEQGIIWPLQVAPFHVVIVPTVAVNEDQMKASEEIYRKLKDAGIEILLDDRDERAGVKFKDADLIGIPIRITLGKKLKEGIVEYKLRNSSIAEDIKVGDVFGRVMEDIKKAI